MGHSDLAIAGEVFEDRTLLATLLISDDGGGNFTTIQAAINAAASGDILQVSGGADRIHTEQGILINKRLTIQGIPGSTQVIVQAHALPGMATNRVFEITQTTFVTIDNLTIRHGNSATPGGGISNMGQFDLRNSTITGNIGGGISAGGFGIRYIRNCIIANNTGSGIYNSGTLSVVNSTISGNTTDGDGGGIANRYGALYINNSTISGNSARGNGGGISSTGNVIPRITMSNSTISGNIAGGNGGGIANFLRMTLINSTISGNSALGNGGGIFNQSPAENSTITINNTIIAGSVGRDLFGTGSFTGTNNLIQDGIAPAGLANTISGNPILGPLQNNGGLTKTHALMAGSPAINAGVDSLAVRSTVPDGGLGFTPLTADQRGRIRYVGTVDLGAFEFAPSLITVNTLVDENNGINTGTISLREAINTIGDGGTIVFDSFLTGGTIQLTNGELLIDRALTIDGGASNITINAQGNSRVFRIDDGTASQISVSLNSLTIRGGAATGPGQRGGGILNLETLNVLRSTILGNTADTGGGIANQGTLNVTNSTLSTNAAQAAGGGILNMGMMTVTNATIVENSALFSGGGIFNQSASTSTLNNTIVAGSIAGDLGGTGTLNGTNNLIQDGSGTGLAGTITGNPMLGPLQNNGGPTETYALLSGSPALNAGQNFVAVDVSGNPLTTDQRGRSRFVGTVDIGAVEVVALSIAADAASRNEGTGGTTSFTFTVTLSEPLGIMTTVNYAVGGANVEMSDFVGGNFPTGTVTFNPGETQKLITIAVVADSNVEAPETFTVTLSNASFDTAIAVFQASSTILDDDSATLTLAAMNATRLEGSGGGTTAFTFSVVLNNAVEGGLNVAYTTNDGTATTTDFDYEDNDGSLTFTGIVGEVKTISVLVNEDAKVEANESFNVALGLISGLGPGVDPGRITTTGSAQAGTIQNDDTATLILAGVNASQLEGTGSTPTLFRFSVTLDNAVQGGFNVAYTTNDGPLTPNPSIGLATLADGDYQDNDGSLHFAGTASERLFIDVLVGADAKVEATELFNVVLGAISGLGAGIDPGSVRLSDSLDDRQQNGTILNNRDGIDDDNTLITFQSLDPLDLANLGPGFANLTNLLALAMTGGSAKVFAARSSNAVQGGFRVRYSTNDGTAKVADGDYVDNDGILTFAGLAGEVQMIVVQVNDNNQVEPQVELFSVALGQILDLGPGIDFRDLILVTESIDVTIENETTLTASISLATMNADRNEGTGGTTTDFTFSVTLNIGVQGGFNLAFTTNNGTATTADGDYIDNDGTLTFAGTAGEMKTITVRVNHDNNVEPNDTFSVALGAITGLQAGIDPAALTISGSPRTGTIRNDDGNGQSSDQIFVTAAGPGGGPHVRVFNSTDFSERLSFFAYDARIYTGGVRVAVGDVNGDGTPDIITGTGPGGGPHVKVFDGTNGAELYSFFAFGPSFFGGSYMGAADFTGDGRAEIIVGADAGGNSHVKVFNVNQSTTTPLFSFYAYGPGFFGGVRVAAGDVNGDGTPDIITGAGVGGRPHIRIFDGSVPQETTTPTDLGGPVGSFYAFLDTEFFGGVFVSSGDFNGDNRSDIVVGAGPGGGPLVRIISGADGSELIANYAYQSSFTGGVYVAVTMANGDNRPDLVVGPGRGGNPVVSVQDLIAGNIIRSFEPFGSTFAGGVFVGGSLPQPIAPSPSNSFLALRVDAKESPSGPVEALQQSAIQSLIDEAVNQFEQAHLATSESLSEVDVEITDLEGDLLGEVIGDTIRLDRDAAGFGWFIDPTPLDDVEFQTGNPEVFGRVDLLTVLTHELGHILGLTHHNDEPNFMSERLALGTRHRIELDEAIALDSVFANHALPDLME